MHLKFIGSINFTTKRFTYVHVNFPKKNENHPLANDNNTIVFLSSCKVLTETTKVKNTNYIYNADDKRHFYRHYMPLLLFLTTQRTISKSTTFIDLRPFLAGGNYFAVFAQLVTAN